MGHQFIEKVRNTSVDPGKVALFFLGQAGFWLKTADGRNIILDAYLSDVANRLFGFRRMTPSVLDPEEVDVDLYLSTHSHVDHLDVESLPEIAKNERIFFVGAPDCRAIYEEVGLPAERFQILREGESTTVQGVSLRAVYADHGDLAPDAVGLLLEVDGVKIYHAGDTSLQVEKIQASLATDIDVLIAPINGQFGNLTAAEACRLAEALRPGTVIACHFWTFLEHVAPDGLGDPTTFLREGKQLPDGIVPWVLAPGEMFSATRK